MFLTSGRLHKRIVNFTAVMVESIPKFRRQCGVQVSEMSLMYFARGEDVYSQCIQTTTPSFMCVLLMVRLRNINAQFLLE